MGCQTTSETLKKYPVGTNHSGFIAVSKKQIPLPSGEWEIFAARSSLSSQNTPMLSFAFGNRDRNAPIMAVTVYTNAEVTLGTGWTNLKACNRSNMIHLDRGETDSGGNKGCWFINHKRTTRSGNKGNLFNEMIERAKALEIRLPVTFVYSGFRISDTHDVLTVRVYFNPEAEGFDAPRQSAWATNDWHIDRIYLDRKKDVYVEKMKTWAAAFFSKVEAGFNGKLVPARPAAK